MSILSKTKSFTVFICPNVNIAPEYETLRLIHDNTPEDGSINTGFANILDPLTMSPELPLFEHLSDGSVAAMRMDRRVVPRKLLVQAVGDEARRLLADTGREFLSRSELKQIKERVEYQLFAKAPVTPNAIDVAVQGHAAIVFSTSAKSHEAFQDLMGSVGNFFLPLNFLGVAKQAGVLPEDIPWDVTLTTQHSDLAEMYFVWLLHCALVDYIKVTPFDRVVMSNEKEKVIIHAEDIYTRAKDIAAQLERGLRISHIGLEIEGLSTFTLDRSFQFSGFKSSIPTTKDSYEDLILGLGAVQDTVLKVKENFREFMLSHGKNIAMQEFIAAWRG